MPKVKKGKYQHFKGNFYEVVGMAKNSENIEEEWVVYRPLYKSDVIPDLCIRPLKMFVEKVDLPAGRQGKKGKKVPRFKFMGK